MPNKEPLANVGLMCPHHQPKPRPELYADRPLQSFVGKHVKLGFETRPEPEEFKKDFPDRKWPDKEHMWVEVKSVSVTGKELHGVIANDPILCDLSCGQGVVFTADEIEMVYGEPEMRG